MKEYWKTGTLTTEEAMRIAKKFGDAVVEKHKDLIKAVVLIGSSTTDRQSAGSDVDVFVVIDDTQENSPSAKEDELDKDLESIASRIDERLSIQPSYTLTEFWEHVRVGHPIIYNFIKDGLAVYDVGFFAPLKNLLKQGKIPGTEEAVENSMDSANTKVLRAKTVKLLIVGEDCYYAMLNSAQAVLMAAGLSAPSPTDAYDEVRKQLVDNNLLDQEYATWLAEIVETRKKIVRKELEDVNGPFVDEWIGKAEKFVEKMESLRFAMRMLKSKKIIERTYEVLLGTMAKVLKVTDDTPKDEAHLAPAFRREFVDKGRIDKSHWQHWEMISAAKRDIDAKKEPSIGLSEAESMRESGRKMIRALESVLMKEEKEKVKVDQATPETRT